MPPAVNATQTMAVSCRQRVVSLLVSGVPAGATLITTLATLALTATTATASTTTAPITAHVTHSVDNSAAHSLTPLTMATNPADTPLLVGHRPQHRTATPDANTASVTNHSHHSLTPHEVATTTPGHPLAATPAATPTPASGVTTTTITLTITQVPLIAQLGTIAIPIATVEPPTALGTVQFDDQTTTFSAPVSVVAGIAVGPARIFKGPHTLTAVFTPTNPTTFTPSTSNNPTITF